jgi:WXXGXW repeat (2 copies)
VEKNTKAVPESWRCLMKEDVVKTLQPENTRPPLRRAIVAGLAGTLLLMLAFFVAPTPASARVSVGIFVGFGPPALPVYAQPPCPAPGYIWTPGYWAWDPAYGYYWVPGTWVPAPFIGAMWTPGYWGFYDGGYRWHPGYWGYSVGFYGGINYGFGYTSYGYFGGYWDHDHFYYNRAFNRIEGRNFRHFYSRRVEDRFRDRRVSYNGGRGGIEARPTRGQLAAERGRRIGPVNQQLRQERFARTDRSQWARENHGRPGTAATRRPGEFRGHGAVRATRAGEPYRAPVERTRGGREFSRSAPQRGNNNGGFHSFSQQRGAQPNWQRGNRAPVEHVNRQPMNNNQQRSFDRGQGQRQYRQQEMRRVESRPAQRGPERQVLRNDPPRNFQRVQQQSRPQQTRRVESRPAPQQRGNSSRQEAHGGGNGHNGGNGHGHGGDNGQGRGGRH